MVSWFCFILWCEGNNPSGWPLHLFLGKICAIECSRAPAAEVQVTVQRISQQQADVFVKCPETRETPRFSMYILVPWNHKTCPSSTSYAFFAQRKDMDRIFPKKISRNSEYHCVHVSDLIYFHICRYLYPFLSKSRCKNSGISRPTTGQVSRPVRLWKSLCIAQPRVGQLRSIDLARVTPTGNVLLFPPFHHFSSSVSSFFRSSDFFTTSSRIHNKCS